MSRAMWVCPPSSLQDLAADHMRSIAVWPTPPQGSSVFPTFVSLGYSICLWWLLLQWYHLPEIVIPPVSLMMLVTRDLSLSPAIFSSSLAFACSLIFFSMAAATALSNLAFLVLASPLPRSAHPLLCHSRSSVFCSFVSLEYSLLS